MEIRLAVESDKDVLVPMVNQVYYSSERDFWADGYYRLTDNDFDSYLIKDWLYVLMESEKLIGCVLLKQEEPKVSSFSMLVCHPDHRKQGIGNRLVKFVTETAIQRGNTSMNLEILSPKYWEHKEKVFLKRWYMSMGYQLIKEVDFKDYYPDHMTFMRCELVFSLYKKSLI
ncbi:MAG: GNAT family N-acetyltransferase [Crocinitomicaceae bacterium]|jgi:N-acetylglutamate synthase-like GNAT family acetyltransferase|nr:GNAT family N-acetyltransferase [Crocinitomicaceae bacterium]